MVGKEGAKPLLSTFEKYWSFPTLFGAAILDSLQCVGELLKKLNKEKKSSVATTAILISELKMVEIEIAEEEEKRKEYYAEILVKLVTLEEENNTQTVLGYIESSLKLNIH